MTDSIGIYYYNKGLSACKNNDLTLAVKALNNATVFGPNRSQAWNLLGLCYYKLGQFRMAQSIWTKSVQIQPSNNDANAYLETLHQDLSKLSTAFDRVSSLCEGHHYQKARALFEKEMMTDYSECVDILNYYGVLQFLTHRKKQAIKTWRKALVFDQQNEKASMYIREMVLMENQNDSFFKKLIFWKN